jgi:thioredoxin-related protein
MPNKNLLTIIFFTIFCSSSSAQTPFTVYDTTANAMLQIDSLVSVAKSQKKHVFLQVGGNWCKWCRKFHAFAAADSTVHSLFKAGYIVGHINYSKNNKNPEAMKRLGYPQRFGFPVFVILDSEGNRIHTQNTSYLEGGDGYDSEKVAEFLKHWMSASLKEETYR